MFEVVRGLLDLLTQVFDVMWMTWVKLTLTSDFHRLGSYLTEFCLAKWFDTALEVRFHVDCAMLSSLLMGAS